VLKIRIDYRKCTGCRLCEEVCSLEHTGAFQPTRSRIRVFVQENFYFPIIAGPYTESACNARHVTQVDGEEFDACILCRASCPVKPIFKEPDTEIPLKCDFCGEPPNPQCVSVCINKALVLVDDEEEPKEEEKTG
jgi:Fe-S-cluster-containing hydrogenase component 2